ncbi:MAG: potassium channel family protein [Mycobacteriales bacterium]
MDPVRAILRRAAIGAGVLLLITLLVWLDRDGYSDIDDDVSLLDALYYATVSASTTGYGDIAPVSYRARTVNTLLITPLRVVFVVVLVGTTVEVLARTGRDRLRVARWQRTVRGHTVIVGFGTKGRAAADHLLAEGEDRSSLVVVTDDLERIEDARDRGLVAIVGDGTRDDILRAAVIDKAQRTIVAVPHDATAVLVTLTARRLNPTATIIGAVKKNENAQLMRDSGANSVMVSADSAGRRLAANLTSPAKGAVLEQLLDPNHGLELVERLITAEEDGRQASQLDDLVVSVLRPEGALFADPRRDITLHMGDRVAVLRSARAGASRVRPDGDQPPDTRPS